MCGIIGIYGKHDAFPEIYEGLLTLQHRGQDAAGIATFSNKVHMIKGKGLIRELFNAINVHELKGNLGIAHVRYSTVGKNKAEDAQPLVLNGIAIAHNGNVTNYHQLRKELETTTTFQSFCDSEVILHVFEQSIRGKTELKPEDIYEAVKKVFAKVKGAYSVLIAIHGKGLIAFRDPFGIRPLMMGTKEDSFGFASESAALVRNRYTNRKNVIPGEVIYIDENKILHRQAVAEPNHHPCIFEYMYFARPDTFMEFISVYKTRLRAGDALAKKIKQRGIQADVVIPVPDSSRPAASTLSFQLGLKNREGLVKNRYIGRTFIMPNQKERKKSIRRKLSPIKLEFKDKKVILIDDSIIRGNTSKEIIKMCREAGAKEIHFASYSAPVKYPCVYGIDMQTRTEFIAQGRTEEEIAKEIGADSLTYQDVDDMIATAQAGNPNIKHFCTACFTGE